MDIVYCGIDTKRGTLGIKIVKNGYIELVWFQTKLFVYNDDTNFGLRGSMSEIGLYGLPSNLLVLQTIAYLPKSMSRVANLALSLPMTRSQTNA